MGILSLKRWARVEYEVEPGVTIHMKLKRLKRHEVKPLARVLIAVWGEIEKSRGEEMTRGQKAAILAQAYEVVPEEQLKQWFGDCVKDVEGVEIDDQPMTTGAGLLEDADDKLMFWLLMKLHTLSKLTQSEGKVSALPAPSSSTPAQESSDSPATPIAQEVGTSR